MNEQRFSNATCRHFTQFSLRCPLTMNPVNTLREFARDMWQEDNTLRVCYFRVVVTKDVR